MIELQNVNKKFYSNGVELIALDSINLAVDEAEIVGVIGASGAGKSTLIRTVNLLEKPDTGKVIIDGTDIAQLGASQLRTVRRKIGMIFQHFNLLSSQTVYNNIALPLRLNGDSAQKIDEEVSSLLSLTGLTDKKNDYPSQLSGGQKQRVAIARALANKPKILLSDEATSSLDPQSTQDILQLLKTINKKLKLTILLITHEMDVVKEICHRLAILKQGQIIEQDNVINFFYDPQSDTSKQLVHQTLRQNLPSAVQQRLLAKPQANSNQLVRFTFIGTAAQEPLIADTVKNYSININILQANIETIHDKPVGTMIVEISGQKQHSDQAMAYLTSKGIKLEVIGHVEPHH